MWQAAAPEWEVLGKMCAHIKKKNDLALLQPPDPSLSGQHLEEKMVGGNDQRLFPPVCHTLNTSPALLSQNHSFTTICC